jgi:hypothetical protein
MVDRDVENEVYLKTYTDIALLNADLLIEMEKVHLTRIPWRIRTHDKRNAEGSANAESVQDGEGKANASLCRKAGDAANADGATERPKT